MKRLLLLIAVLIACALSSTSCLTSMLVYEYGTLTKDMVEHNMNNINKTTTSLNLRVFQTLSPFEGLATTPKYDVVNVRTVSRELYDGLQLKGTFIMVDTYTYTTRKGYTKTVPVFVPKGDYKYYKKAIESGLNLYAFRPD